jgi:purine-nucleoside phosphorylase
MGQAPPEGAALFPDMTQCYDREYIRLAEEAARGRDIPLREGVLMAFSGPSYETPAEIRMAGMLGPPP